MRKQNLLSKKIGKQIVSINNLLESYFNSLRRFILDIKRLRFDKNNKVFLVIVSIIFLTLVYFLIPTAYNKELIQKEIKNQIYQKYNIVVKFDNIIQYNFFPKPHFSSKNLSILSDKRKIAEVKNFKILIDFKNFFNAMILYYLDFPIRHLQLLLLLQFFQRFQPFYRQKDRLHKQ